MADAKLARCPRCKAHGLVAERSGIRVALDIAPADPLRFGVAVASGVDLYWVQIRPGRGLSVSGRYSGTPRPSWGPAGAQEGAQRLHVEHNCGSPARDMVLINVTSPKGSAPATPGSRPGGSHLPVALAAGAKAPASPSPATTATLPRSERRLVCSICDQLIIRGLGEYTAIECGEYTWAAHEECP